MIEGSLYLLISTQKFLSDLENGKDTFFAVKRFANQHGVIEFFGRNKCQINHVFN